MSQEQTAKQRLVYAILKFLNEEIQAESANAERRESMEGILFIHIVKGLTSCSNNYIYLVAVQCIETAYEVSLANIQNDSTCEFPVDLLSLISESSSTRMTAAHATNFSTWLDANERPVTIRFLLLTIIVFVLTANERSINR